MGRLDGWRPTRRRFLQTTLAAGAGVAAVGVGMTIGPPNAAADPPHARGLLTSPGFEGQPVKGLLPSAEGADDTLWTTHPSDPRDHTVIASYWSNMP